MVTANDFTPYSTLRGFIGNPPAWVPEEEQQRIQAYLKYDEMYWNDSRQFSLRVLEGEDPLYIPNARTIVDTTAHYLLKGLTVTCSDNDKTLKEALSAFMDREMFYPRFHTAKHRGVALGDFVFHLTANPAKPEGSRISLTAVDPGQVFPIWADDSPDKLVGCHIVEFYYRPDDTQEYIKKLTYRLEEKGETRKISREEGIYKLEPKWYGPKPELVEKTLQLGYLDPAITSIPVYWFKNIDWDWQYGSSELKGFESILRAISQGSTDVQGALSLEGLGVYATDGGRPIDEEGNDADWEVAPGRVMEVPAGSYFRRVEGVGSITPATDQIGYLESKLREAGGLSDVALGRVDVQTAQSGIALAIKFLPTLAKIEERDLAGIGRLKQLFFDWKTWHGIFERQQLTGDVIIEIGDKLPQNRTERINELNNMLDRKVISIQYYRDEMKKLGYEFPDNIQSQIDEEAQKAAEQAAAAAPPNLQENAINASTGNKPPPANGGLAEKQAANRSNNRKRVNESNGTEAK